MTDTFPQRRLTLAGALKALNACIAKAEAMKVPQRIAVTDDAGHLSPSRAWPILIDGQVVGAIGVGSGTGDQDREVALAGVAAIEGAHAG